MVDVFDELRVKSKFDIVCFVIFPQVFLLIILMIEHPLTRLYLRIYYSFCNPKLFFSAFVLELFSTCLIVIIYSHGFT
jgi:hypothetical protein